MRDIIEIKSASTSRREQSAFGLTPKELQVAQLAYMRNRDIAAALGIAEPTVKTYMDRARIKAGADNRTHLFALVMGSPCAAADVNPVAAFFRRAA